MEQDLLFLLYTYFLLVIHFANTHWHLLCVQPVLGDVDRKKKETQPGLLLQLTSRMNIEVRKAPIVNLCAPGPNSWERSGLRTQK